MLLTLGIIGVVAAITIPNLVQNSQNRELVSGLKKTYNTLTNGFKQSEVLLGKTTDIPYLTEREISRTTEREITIADCSSNQTLVNGTCANLSCLSGQKADNHQCVADLTNCSSKTGSTCDTCASVYQRINGGCIRPAFCDSTTGDCKLMGTEIYDFDNIMISNQVSIQFYDDAQKTCSAKGMRLPTRRELLDTVCQNPSIQENMPHYIWTSDETGSGKMYTMTTRDCQISVNAKNVTSINPSGLGVFCVADKNLD